ncbi:bifunctional ADP-dependent NAD(P)H-hydrate dehydratase/NAD(P)H-hydrate epimerase [Nocardia cyriacigeorgica]|uniref:ADP-dependent (S)-NAD(P)H-hydrate dehydratase n=1 Tax=Nocardia cyriacigeorgica TaxID=135487 RepID=A0A5R8PG07_9NOCA|nr:bifunctional ADP-dependent NAD(P)H-hydrate dehydratase/NAD(P)H-hydrate epimerase [Nocardia cyriacigeorgica]
MGTEPRSAGTYLAYPSSDVQRAVAKQLETGRPDRLLRKAAAGLATIAANQLERRYGSVYGRRVTMLVGTGNNGADALLAGVRLRLRGVRVDAVLTGAAAYEPGVRQLLSARGRVIPGADTSAGTASLRTADLILDGIVGESGQAGLRGAAAELVAAIPPRTPVIAVDLPSGVDPDTGEIRGPHVRADLTVTFGEWKGCLLLPPAAHAAGKLAFVSVGLPKLEAEPTVRRLGASDLAARWPVPPRVAHKYTRGVLGIVAGSDRYPGAAVLAVLGAVESGAAGIARFIGPDSVTAQVLAAVPEAVPGIGQVQAWLLGSGVEDDELQDKAIDKALGSGQPCVVDAGALEACVRRRLDGERPSNADSILLTPHAGELARMMGWLGRPTERAEVEARPLHYGRELARALEVTVLVKGPTTIIVGPRGVVASQAEAPPWLATAGAGDILAGIAGALMAAGLNALDAGELAAFVHGRAAMVAHRARGGGPLTARAVGHALPTVVGELLGAPHISSATTLAPG